MGAKIKELARKGEGPDAIGAVFPKFHNAQCISDLDVTDYPAFLEELAAAKRQNKLRLAEYIRKNMEIEVDPDSVFDVQVKRLHAYKRQLLNGFKILDLYNRLKADPNLPINNYTFIFAGKKTR